MYFICSYCFIILKQPERTVILCMIRLVVRFLAKSEGLVFPSPDPEAGDKSGILVAPYGDTTLGHTVLHPGMGGLVWTILVVTNSEPRTLPLGLASPYHAPTL